MCNQCPTQIQRCRGRLLSAGLVGRVNWVPCFYYTYCTRAPSTMYFFFDKAPSNWQCTLRIHILTLQSPSPTKLSVVFFLSSFLVIFSRAASCFIYDSCRLRLHLNVTMAEKLWLFPSFEEWKRGSSRCQWWRSSCFVCAFWPCNWWENAVWNTRMRISVDPSSSRASAFCGVLGVWWSWWWWWWCRFKPLWKTMFACRQSDRGFRKKNFIFFFLAEECCALDQRVPN